MSGPRSTRQAAPPLPRGGRPARDLDESRSRGHSSSSSASSNNSSIFDGRKQSYDSSTSYEDDRDYKSSRKAPVARSKGRERYAREEAEEEEGPEAPPPPGAGSSIWNRMAAVAGALTVNVTKAWESGGTLNDGETTPAGQESRLTKFLKEYHIKNARSAKDLPSWLFDEKERRAQRDQEDDGGRTSLPPRSKSRARGRDDPIDDEPLPAVPRRGGLRDIYEQASNSSQSSSVPSSRTTGSSSLNDRGRDSNVGGGNSSKASSRLKALKDAKRVGSGSSARRGYDEDSQADSYEDTGGRDDPPPSSARTVRPGLPQGPGPRRR